MNPARAVNTHPQAALHDITHASVLSTIDWKKWIMKRFRTTTRVYQTTSSQWWTQILVNSFPYLQKLRIGTLSLEIIRILTLLTNNNMRHSNEPKTHHSLASRPQFALRPPQHTIHCQFCRGSRILIHWAAIRRPKGITFLKPAKSILETFTVFPF